MNKYLLHAIALVLLSVAITMLIFENNRLRESNNKREREIISLRTIALSPYNQGGREYWVEFGTKPYTPFVLYSGCKDGNIDIANIYDGTLECSRCASEDNINNYKIEWKHNNKQED